MRNSNIFLLKKCCHLIILTLIVLWGCAKIGTLTGGPKDVTPPKMVKSIPENYSVNFSKKKIEIWFDEYIQLKDANQKLVISPPMAKKPTLLLKAKSFEIQLRDTLMQNTTYTLNFGKSIVDNNEGNPVNNFRYVFSTGSYLDSLSVAGNAVNAFDLSPDKDPLLVILQDNLSDTAIYKVLPIYIGITDGDGNYKIENLHEGQFHLYIIKDANSNLKYDPVSEPVAFIDSVFTFSYKDVVSISISDSILDSDLNLDFNSDIDTIQSITTIKLPQMLFFTEQETKMYIKNNDRKDKRKLEIISNIPVDNFVIQGINVDLKDRYIFEQSITHDSLTLWILDSTIYNRDTIKIAFSYHKPDSIKTTTDTLKCVYFPPEVVKTKKSLKPIIIKNKLSVNPTSSTLDLNKPIIIESPLPIKEVDTSFIHLFEKLDSSLVQLKYTLYQDSLNLHQLQIQYPWEPETNYKIEIFPGAITDYYHTMTDTIHYNYLSQRNEYYGNLILMLKNVHDNLIIQLFEKNIISQRFINSDTTLLFNFLNPSSYSIKAIFDNNKNKKWDTGNLKKKIQPEKVIWYKKDIKVRSNWDIEETWNMDNTVAKELPKKENVKQ